MKICDYYIDVVAEKRSKSLNWSPIRQKAVTDLAAARQNAATEWVFPSELLRFDERQPSQLLHFDTGFTEEMFCLSLSVVVSHVARIETM